MACRVVLRDSTTGADRYLQVGSGWSADPALATQFPDRYSALPQACQMYDLWGPVASATPIDGPIGESQVLVEDLASGQVYLAPPLRPYRPPLAV